MRLFPRLFFTALLTAPAGAQTTWFVDASASLPGDGSPGLPFQQIQEGLDAAAASGDTVRVLSGTYLENLVLDGKSVQLNAASGLGSVTVDGGGIAPVFTIQNHPVGTETFVSGMRFENGAGAQVTADIRRGGGLYITDPARTGFEACEFAGSVAEEGGGAFLNGGAHVFVGCSFDDNRGDVGGGLHAAGANLVLQATSVSDNEGLTGFSGGFVERLGVGIALTAGGATPLGALIEDCQISRNTASPAGDGGGIYVASGGDVMIRNTVISENDRLGANGLGGRGGGIAAGSNTTLEDCEIRDNGSQLSYGGGTFGGLTARNCVIAGNEAAQGGGASGGTFVDCLFEGNAAGDVCCAEGALGGAAYQASLTGCVLRANRARNGPVLVGAGAAFCELQSCVVEYNFIVLAGSSPFVAEGGGLANCTAVDTIIRGNSAPTGGGAASCIGFAGSLLRCTIQDNLAWETGGGVANCALEDCVLSGNEAGSFGGGAVDSDLFRCVVSGNAATTCAGAAGGTLDFCTVTGNFATSAIGGAGSADDFLMPYLGSLTSITNSIVYSNEPDNVGLAVGDSPATPQLEAQWSLLVGGWPGMGNLDADGLVAGPYAGSAQLLSASPAIDAADPSAPLDSDGTRADMGTVPFDPTFVPMPAAYCTGKASGIGVVPVISWSGSPTLSGPDDFTLRGIDLPGQSFALVALATAAAATEAYGGSICLGQGLVRLAVLATGGTAGGADGAVTASLTQAELAAYGSGSLLYAQILVRDVDHPDGSGAALSGGLEFRVLP